MNNNQLTTALGALIEHNNRLNSMQAGSVKDEKEFNNVSWALAENDRTQDESREEFTAQEALVQKYIDKLNTIKAYN